MGTHPLDRLPSLRTIPKRVPGEVYNTLRVALLRSSSQVRLAIGELRPGLCALLDERAWLILDEIHQDMPLLAWTEFRPQSRTGLHQDVPCELRVFHRCAGLFMGPGLDALHRAGADYLGRSAKSESP